MFDNLSAIFTNDHKKTCVKSDMYVWVTVIVCKHDIQFLSPVQIIDDGKNLHSI